MHSAVRTSFLTPLLCSATRTRLPQPLRCSIGEFAIEFPAAEFKHVCLFLIVVPGLFMPWLEAHYAKSAS